MNYNDLTSNERRRFRKDSICPVCNKKIFVYDDFILNKTRYSRYIKYNFIHRGCNNEEKEKKV